MARWQSPAARATLGAGAMALLSALPAGADTEAQITVTPDAGLTEGQVVTVDGRHWPSPAPNEPFRSRGLFQCDVPTFTASRCGRLQGMTEEQVEPDGSFSVRYAVSRSFRSHDDSRTLTCGTEPEDCYVVAVFPDVTPSRPTQIDAEAPISFRPSSK